MNRLMAPVLTGILTAGTLLGATACSSKSEAPAPSSTTSAATTAAPSSQRSATAQASSSPAASATIQPNVSNPTEHSVEDVVKLADPSIVRIQTDIGVGTGFIVSTDGYLITNNHVIAGRNGQPEATVQVTLSDGTTMNGRVVGADARSDIAVVKLDGNQQYSALKLGTIDNVAVGEDVIAIGYALDLKAGEGASYSVTKGIVSAKNRAIDETSVTSGAIQTDAAINHGNSGGPLLDLTGAVIGVNTSLAPDPTTGQAAAGIGFAVGADTIQAVYDDIRATGAVSRGYLGIQGFQELRPAQARTLNIPDTTRGVYLSAADAVAPGSPADQGGLRSGDVITKIDGVEIHTESDLTVQMIREEPNKTVEVDIYRAGQQQTLQITLGTPPAG
jgi:S1-C subfamily serine protease